MGFFLREKPHTVVFFDKKRVLSMFLPSKGKPKGSLGGIDALPAQVELRQRRKLKDERRAQEKRRAQTERRKGHGRPPDRCGCILILVNVVLHWFFISLKSKRNKNNDGVQKCTQDMK